LGDTQSDRRSACEGRRRAARRRAGAGRAGFPRDALGYDDVPFVRLPFPTRVVASSNDPYASLAFARRCAQAWGSRFVEVGERGHINAESGLDDWPEGRAWLASLAYAEQLPD
jgi:predicted alpha/beta hydrolase family esterase